MAIRDLVAALAAGLVFAAGASSAGAAPNTSRVLEEKEVLAKSEAAIGRKLDGFVFEMADKSALRLEELRGRPVIVNLVYTSCYEICPTITQSLSSAVDAADRNFGSGRFSVVTVGFDSAADTVERMGSYARMHGIDRKNWHFLSAEPMTMFRFVDAIGFSYASSSKGFDHVAQTTVLDAEGRVYRQVYGDQLRAKDIMQPLRELLIGGVPAEKGVSAMAERFRLLCTIYDPKADRYRFSYAMLLSFLIGSVCLLGTAFVVARGWWRSRGRA
jgi:protein SCO1/2